MQEKKQKNNHTEALKTFLAWIETRKKSRQEVAVELKVMYAQFARWINGRIIPSLKYAAAIEVMTKGKVKCIMWTQPLTLSKNKVKSSK